VKPGATGVQALERAAAVIREHPEAVVLVGGYADSSALNPRNVRKYGDNTGLSLSRAMSVYRLLKQLGADESRMVVLAHGAGAAARDPGASSKSTGKRRVSVVLELPGN
jgi:flagellar motor protein MotB